MGMQQTELGVLERTVMETVWARGESSVREVSDSIGRPLAYTTIMTTLDRLFRKGLLRRRLSGRAFLYTAQMSRAEWERRRAGEILASFLEGPESSRDLLVSCFLDAIGQDDEGTLEKLEEKIRLMRRQLSGRGDS